MPSSGLFAPELPPPLPRPAHQGTLMSYTIVFFHAHPDDEAIATGGTMARASRQRHRVVLGSATRGELREFAPDSLPPGEELVDPPAPGLNAAAEIPGVH